MAKKPTKKAPKKELLISAAHLLYDARSNLDEAAQYMQERSDEANFYSASNADTISNRVRSAEVLIDTVEAAHCGSVGGFDPAQQNERRLVELGDKERVTLSHGLRQRLDHLISIYGAKRGW